LTDAFVGDELVSHLLMLHGLHPDDVENRVQDALESVRPYIQSHGGSVELIGVSNGVVKLQLGGHCKGCPSSSLTLRTAVEDAIRAVAPEIVRIEADGVADTTISTEIDSADPVLVTLMRAGVHEVNHGTNYSTVHDTEPISQEQCGLCGVYVPDEHRHLIDLSERRIVCACRACSLLFEDNRAGGHHYRLIPDRYRRLTDFDLSDAVWAELDIPVDMAFLFFDTAAGRIVALYPGAMGVAESRLSLNAWDELVKCNPILEGLERDVEALLINRTHSARQYWLVPIDACYALAGIIRRHWKGLAGGEEVWEAIEVFFRGLEDRSVGVSRNANVAPTHELIEEHIQ
jgi:Fe-S cluster biogenesis protein NfuA